MIPKKRLMIGTRVSYAAAPDVPEVAQALSLVPLVGHEDGDGPSRHGNGDREGTGLQYLTRYGVRQVH